jgi:hypothetical protein
MFHTFSYDSKHHQLVIASKVYSDFASHIPQIRSFSKGQNWPPQLPLYPGEKTRYHFLFFAVSGILEKFGLPIDLALNLPSALGFSALLFLIFITSSRIFSSLKVGVFSVALFLFNGSFSFLDFFSSHPLSLHTFTDIITNSTFPSFAPWNGSLITAFWNLNIYTNQRHLGLSFAISLLIIYILITNHRKLLLLVGFLLGSLLLINQAAFIIAAVYCIWIFFTNKQERKTLLVSLIGLFPWFLVMINTMTTSPSIKINPWFLMPAPHTLPSFIIYWLMNFGLHLFLIPIGMFISPPRAKPLVVPTVLLFISANIWQFSPDMINNHKFLNFYLLIGSMFTAYLLSRWLTRNFFIKLATLLISFFLVLGGLIDLFPIKNDYYVKINDLGNNPYADFYLSRTSPGDVILNSVWLYHPASLAGRFIYNGYPYFTWSYGYNQVTREQATAQIYSARSKPVACLLLAKANISFVQLGRVHESFINPNWDMWLNDFHPDFSNPGLGEYIYSVKGNCLSL